MKALLNTDHFNLSGQFGLARGKVCDIYTLDSKQLLVIRTDRYSAFDVVLNEPIPGRGVILNTMTKRWLDVLSNDINALGTEEVPIMHHIISTYLEDLPEEFKPFASELEGRFALVHQCLPLPIEFIVRGYMSGSYWKEYQRALQEQTGDMITIHGFKLRRDMKESQEFPTTLFTPSTKAFEGQHDQNISQKQMLSILTSWVSKQNIPISAVTLSKISEQLSLRIYGKGREYAQQRGIIIADTKFEFGLLWKNLIWNLVIIDEVLTPDSSRFWPADKYQIGQSQPSFDKQPVRDYLADSGWDKKPPPPPLPKHVIAETVKRYEMANHLLFSSGDKNI